MFRALLLALIMTATSAHAHAKLTASNPADGAVITVAPTLVTLNFTKPIRLASVEMNGPNGTVIALDMNADAGFEVKHDLTSPGGGIGTYTLIWRGFSEDGHLLKGEINFEVK